MDGNRSPELSQPEITDPRIDQYINEYLSDINAVLQLTEAQRNALRPIAEKNAQAKIDQENKINQLEAENTRLQEQSDRDPYNPDIYSANGWYRILIDKFAELRRNRQKAVIAAFDLDGFKQFNDEHGHLAGDNALGLGGKLAKAVLRPGDIIARLHGDEYVILLANVDNLDSGVIACDRVRTAIAEIPELLNKSGNITASLGIAMIDENSIMKEYNSEEEIKAAIDPYYALADTAQYDGAKKAGKNRIGVYTPDGSIKTGVVIMNSDGSNKVDYLTPESPTP